MKTTTKIKHPAKFSDPILEIMAKLVNPEWVLLDPFAGTGRIHELPCETWGIEIEPEWASCHPRTLVGNALCLPFRNASFDAVATSPTYGNRFADAHNARDGSTRRSYTHDLRAMTGDYERKLHPDNSGKMHFGGQYFTFHVRAYYEVWRVLKPGGFFILNVSDFVKNKKLVEACKWHRETVLTFPFESVGPPITVETQRLKFGENPERAPHEEVGVFRKVQTNGKVC